MTSVLVRGKEILITPIDLFAFWYPDIPILEVDPTYQKPPMHTQYSWIADFIVVGPQSWEITDGQIHWQGLLPEAIVWFDFVRKNLLPSRDAHHVSWDASFVVARIMTGQEILGDS